MKDSDHSSRVPAPGPATRQAPTDDPAKLLMAVDKDEGNVDDLVFTLAEPEDDEQWMTHWIEVARSDVIELGDMR